jgi:hypothetical protein
MCVAEWNAKPREMIRRVVLVVFACAVLVGAVACGAGGPASATQRTMTLDQATSRAHQLFDQAAALLPGAIIVSRGAERPYACDDPTDHGPGGRKIVSVSKRIDGLDRTMYNHYFDVLRDYWLGRGFRVLADFRPRSMFLSVESPSDGFRGGPQANDLGEFYLEMTSPCVWPNGMPSPAP